MTTNAGTGKSTLACCFSAEFKHRARTVTLIDADPQGVQGGHSAGGP